MIKVVSDTRSDGIYTHLIDESVAYTRELDLNRTVDYAADGTLVGIDLLEVSGGIDLSGLPGEESIIDGWVELLSEDYSLENPSEIASYLKSNSFLIVVLFEAPRKIKEHFGADTSLALQILTDAEDDGSDELFVLMLTNLEPEEALRRLAALDDEWWLEAARLTRCQLNIDVHYLES